LLNGLEEKYLLRQVARDLLPPQILAREKFGWFAQGTPALVRLRHPLIEDLLSPARVRRDGYFNPDTVRELTAQYRQPDFELDQPFETDLLAIVITFGLFREIFNLPTLG
jgi:asparagine synthase (glutamine-hydrolysing)